MRLSQERTKRISIPNDPDNGFVVIRNLDLDTIYRIETDTQDISMDGRENQRFSYDPAEREDRLVKACLKSWGQLFDANGNEMKFDAKNLETSRRFVVIGTDENGKEYRYRFYEWINTEREKFAEEVITEEGIAEGN